MDIRQLAANDAPVYQPLRLRALREHPEAFGSSPEDEQPLPLEQVARRLEDTSGNSVSFGAWLDGQLVGIVSLYRSPRLKTRHSAILGGMYVAPEARGNRIGKALLEQTLSYARTMDGLEDVTLAVTVGNNAARRLYLDAGFVPYGVEPRYIKLGNRYFDVEWMILRLVA